MPTHPYPGHIGNWFILSNGRKFYPFMAASPFDRSHVAGAVDIGVIASALSKICRFNGHCDKFYSVAEHCVSVSNLIHRAGGTIADRMWGLLHDASEALGLGDIVTPVKKGFPAVEAFEEGIHEFVAATFGLKMPMPPVVKKADLIAAAWEARDLMGIDAIDQWGFPIEYDEIPPHTLLPPLDPEGAERSYLHEYHHLCAVKENADDRDDSTPDGEEPDQGSQDPQRDDGAGSQGG